MQGNGRRIDGRTRSRKGRIKGPRVTLTFKVSRRYKRALIWLARCEGEFMHVILARSVVAASARIK